jgi:hypothetical protein
MKLIKCNQILNLDQESALPWNTLEKDSNKTWAWEKTGLVRDAEKNMKYIFWALHDSEGVSRLQRNGSALKCTTLTIGGSPHGGGVKRSQLTPRKLLLENEKIFSMVKSFTKCFKMVFFVNNNTKNTSFMLYSF